jgi:hypothetical protein
MDIEQLIKDPRVIQAVYNKIMRDPAELKEFYESMMKEQQGIPRSFKYTHSHSGSDTKSTTETLSGDTDFVLTHMSGFATSLNFTIQIKDDRLGWNLFKDPIKAEHFFGDHSSYYFDGPFYFAAPYKFNRAGSFVVETVDASAAANTVDIALHGLVVLT